MYNLFDIDLEKINLYAHSSKDSETDKELFYEHCFRSLKYYDQIFSIFGLKQIFAKLLGDVDSEGEINQDKILRLLREFVVFHDLGKLTDKFQRKLDGQQNNATHSDKSFLVILYGLFKLNKGGQIKSKEFFILFITLYSVYKHHGRLNNLLEDITSFSGMTANTLDAELILKEHLKEDIDDQIIEIIKDNNFWQSWNKKQKKDLFKKLSKDSLSFFILLKLFHSLLISSDYYATLEYETGEEYNLRSLDESLISEISSRYNEQRDFGDFQNFNVDINARRESLLKQDIQSIKSNGDKKSVLNEIRSFLNVKAESELEKIISSSPENHTFFLNVPTGGGKTNLSLRLALKIMENEKINKLFYVFPFINIIEQTYDSLEKYIGKDNMIRLDSRFVDQTIQEENYDEKVFARHIDTLFFNKPVLFLSHVKFFDMFLRNDKNSNYNFYQLANSVVIIDEIQAYNDELWTEISYIFSSISKFMNTKFIVMSATLPSMYKLANTEFNYIFDEQFTDALFSHPAFDRVEIKTDKKTSKIPKIPKRIIEEKRNKTLVVVNTVKDSYELFDQIKNDKKLKGYETFLLNSTILSDRRKQILNTCKDASEDEKIILVATQSVEAGVDIDFDLGFRDYSPLDSIVQVEGRINRNNSKDKSLLYVINTGSSSNVYRTGVKSRLSENIKDDFFKKEVFRSNEELKKFYDEIIDIHKKNNETSFIESSATNVADMSNLFFKIIDEKIHLIDGDTFSLFIPINDEAEYLWQEYMDLFENKRSYENTIKIKETAKKLSKYSINIFNSYTSKGKIKAVLNEEIRFGYYKCDDWEEYYSLEKGLDTEKFKSAVTGRQVLFI